jgi:myo-inositol-1(or 4)-monophosphatase
MKLDEIIIKAALSAGILLRSGAFDNRSIEWKPGNSPVTSHDKKAELLIREVIAAELGEKPNFLGEEYGASDTGSKYTFIIDPIDGTKPWITREFSSSVSIAAEVCGKLEAACVYDFMRDIMYAVGEDEPYILYSGQRYGLNTNPMDHKYIYVQNLKAVPETHRILEAAGWDLNTRPGSIALAMAQVAAGTYNGIVEGSKRFAPHDVAAGCLLLQRAGYAVYDAKGNLFDYHDPQKGILAFDPELKKRFDDLKATLGSASPISGPERWRQPAG